MKALLENLSKKFEKVAPAAAAAAVIGLGVVDALTGYEISFSIFYLVPIMLVSWLNKKIYGVLISGLSAAAWMWADIASGHTYSHMAIPVWNASTRLGIFLMAALLISRIKSLLEREQAFARVDSLTGVNNSRAFKEAAKTEINKSTRFRRPFTIAYVDIDNFKQVNDTRGHSEGDTLLKLTAETIKNNIRSIDIISRVGGDEFVIFLPETNEATAKTAMNKVASKLIEVVKNHKWPVTFSIGVVTCYESCNLERLIQEADSLMYSVKESGKNRIEYVVHNKLARTA